MTEQKITADSLASQPASAQYTMEETAKYVERCLQVFKDEIKELKEEVARIERSINKHTDQSNYNILHEGFEILTAELGDQSQFLQRLRQTLDRNCQLLEEIQANSRKRAEYKIFYELFYAKPSPFPESWADSQI